MLNDPSSSTTKCTPLEKEKSAVNRADLIPPPVQPSTDSASTEKQAGANLIYIVILFSKLLVVEKALILGSWQLSLIF